MPWTARTAIIVSFVLLGCEQPAPPPAEATLVRALGVQMTQFDRTAALTGEIRARHESNLGFRVGGKVIERLVDVGATVAEGDLLARLDNQDQQNALKAAQSDIAAAQAAIEQSRTQEERQRKLLADGYTTRTQYDNAQRRYAQAQAELAGAQAKLRLAQDTLSYTELRADRAGVVTAKGAEPGQVVASGQMVVRLADPNEREAVFQVPGAGLRLEGGSAQLPPVEVRLVSDQNLVTEGTIREVSPGVDPVTRTYTVKVALTDPPPAFLLGASVVGRAKLPTQSVINLPSSALFQTAQGEPAVWVVDQPQDTVSLRPVSVLQYDTGTVTVSSGLEYRRNGRDRRQPEAQAGTEGHDQAGERSMMNRQVPMPGARLLPAAFLIMAMAGAMTLGGCEERNAHEADAAPVIRPVRTIVVQPVSFSLSGSVTGTIEARAEADLGFRIAGKLIERKVDVGDGVRAGDVLARLDDQDQRNALRTAEADLAAAQAEQVQASNEEARKRELLSRGNTTQVLYDAALMSKRTADAKVVAAQAALQTARDRAGYTELVADRNGVVTSVGPDAGQVVEIGEMVVRVAQPEEREAVFNVAEAGVRSAPKEPVIEVALSRRAGHYSGGPRSGGLAPGRSRHPDPYRADSP